MLNFDPNLKIPLLSGEKLYKNWRKNIAITNMSKMWHLLAKNMLLVSEKRKILYTCKSPRAEKITPKYLFSQGPATLWKWNVKLTNIHKIFAKYFNTYNQFLGLHIQLVPKKIHMLPAAYLNCNWLCCKLPISSWPYSTSPQKYIKSETGQKTIPKYSVWNNYTRRKWVLWWKNSYFPFSIEPDT